MVLREKRSVSLFGLLLCVVQQSFAFFPINIFRPWDINLRPPRWHDTKLQATLWSENSLQAHGYNADGNQVNVMQLWSRTQDALAMLKGFGPSSQITQFLENDLMSPTDNGVRGHVAYTGKFKAKGYGLNFRYHAPHNITLGFYFPIYDMSLKKVQYVDQTALYDVPMSQENLKVRQLLTSRLQQVVNMFDPKLNLGDWSRAGFGDVTFMAEWWRLFKQGRPILKTVSLQARGGMIFPSGVRVNDNDILSIPFGCDGSVGMIFGGGINLNWFSVFHGGIDVEFLQFFGNTRNRRIKIQQEQTDFLLLAKAKAHKDFGFIQRFNLYLEAYQVWHGLSARATYQFWKESDSKLTLCTNEFSNDIANTAESLQEWTMHQAIFQISYDFQTDVSDRSHFKPQISLFYKFPFNGQRAILLNTVGAMLSLSF